MYTFNIRTSKANGSGYEPLWDNEMHFRVIGSTNHLFDEFIDQEFALMLTQRWLLKYNLPRAERMLFARAGEEEFSYCSAIVNSFKESPLG